MAILLLQRGVSVSEIAKRLKLTRQTIYRLDEIKELKSHGFLLALKKVNQDELNRGIKKILLDVAKEMGSSRKGIGWQNVLKEHV